MEIFRLHDPALIGIDSWRSSTACRFSLRQDFRALLQALQLLFAMELEAIAVLYGARDQVGHMLR